MLPLILYLVESNIFTDPLKAYHNLQVRRFLFNASKNFPESKETLKDFMSLLVFNGQVQEYKRKGQHIKKNNIEILLTHFLP